LVFLLEIQSGSFKSWACGEGKARIKPPNKIRLTIPVHATLEQNGEQKNKITEANV